MRLRPAAAAAALAALLLTAVAPAARAPVHPPELDVIGHSVRGRAITVEQVGPTPGAGPTAAPPRTVLVIGCIHGDEGAGRDVVARLRDSVPPAGSRLLLVENVNPDGFARRTRQNAHGVDLNRNGSVGRRDLGPGGSPFYAGPRAFSEPESRAIRALLRRVRPDVTIWYHQPLRGVDVPERGSPAPARRYSRVSGLRLRPLGSRPGSLSRWTNARVRRGSSFVVELAAGRLSAAAARRHALAVLSLASPPPPPRGG